MDQTRRREKLDHLFHPRSLALIGATRSVTKWGFIVLARIINDGYAGEIYPVNPKEKSILGLPAYASVLDIPEPVDLAVITTPAPAVPEVMEQCGRKGVPAAVVITSGFSETGVEGAALEQRVSEIARAHGIVMVGPNSMGIYSAAAQLTCLMAPVMPRPGHVACIAQSGNVGTHFLFRGYLRGLGFRKFVSSGNEGGLDFVDYLDYFGADPEITSIIAYLEGLDPGNRFLEVAKRVTREKPIVVLKGGRSAAGAQAAASHTGALAGSTGLYTGLFRQTGVIQAETNKEVVELARALETQSLPQGRRVGILTRGGGWGVITADACVEAGLTLTELAPETIARLDRLLPPFWSRGNPVDLVAVLSSQVYLDCLRILLADPGVDAVLALGANVEAQADNIMQALGRIEKVPAEEMERMKAKSRKEGQAFVDGIVGLIQTGGKPILMAGRWTASREWDTRLQMLAEPEEAARVLAKMVDYAEYLRR
ncbi:MAG: hypothetical protein A2V67_05380 [Deltaproteobacteria bacterium RBG_13_61_14]|nr:MAG: hypothetical protein A2V67_05380 [Deltaproteobacteria bacterium RBG_13_61_14]